MNFKKISATVIATLFFVGNVYAATPQAKDSFTDLPSGLYKSDDTHTSLTWKVSHLGLSRYTARFTSVKIDLLLNTEAPEKSKATAIIDPKSVRTDYPFPKTKDFDKELAENKEWFNSKRFPKITFVSTKVEKLDEQFAKITGKLTFLGVTKEVTLNARLNGAMKKHPFSGKPVIGFSANTIISRSDWGMASYIPMVGDEVLIDIEAEFIKEE